MNIDQEPILQRIQSEFKEHLPDHNMDYVIDGANDLKNPTKTNTKFYLDYYSTNYDSEQLEKFAWILQNILGVRSDIEEDLKDLGFNFHMDSLFRGVRILSCVIDGAIQIRRVKEDKDADFDVEGAISFEIHGVMQEIDHLQYQLKLEKKQQLVLPEFDNIWCDFMSLLDQDLSKIDLVKLGTELAERFDAFLSEYEIEEVESSRSTSKGLQTHQYSFKSDSFRVSIGEQASFIKRFIEIFTELDRYYQSIEGYQPTSEMISQIEADRLIYGAKAAHLKFLQALIVASESNRENMNIVAGRKALQMIRSKISEATESELEDPRELLKQIAYETREGQSYQSFLDFHIPPTIYIEANLYDRWKSGENVDNELHDLHQQVVQMMELKPTEEDSWDDEDEELNIQTVIVRSSAVHSEDGENHTGAGVYESFSDVLFNDFEAFKSAVTRVWESCDSPEAVSYRQNIGIEDESMGIIIQPDLSENSDHIQVNSSKPQFDDFADALVNHQLPVTLQKRLMPLDIVGGGGRHNGLFSEHSRVDWTSSRQRIHDWQLASLMAISDIMERFLGKPVQLELLKADSLMSGKNYLVQLRPLPVVEKPTIPEFPDIPFLFKGRGVGIGEKRLESSDLLIGYDSYQATIDQSSISLHDVPHAEAVLMLDSFSAFQGHIEQQCVEHGTLLITNDPLAPVEFDRHKLPEEVVIISDGFEGRIYDASLLD